MTRLWSLFLAALSLWLLAGASASARPRYGGTLKLAVPGVIRALDPASMPSSAEDAVAVRHVLPLVFETLTAVAADGGVRPRLATSWAADAQGRWRIRLRDGVRLQDGSVLDAARAVESLRAIHQQWRVSAEAGAVVIDTGAPSADVPWALADLRSAIVIRLPSGELLGTGPFRVEQRRQGRLVLRAHEDYWDGRAFVDAIEIDEGRTPATLLADLELGRTDLAPVQPTERRRLQQRGIRTVASRPLQLFALVFETHRAGAAEEAVRRALAATLDRSAICRVLLQDYGEPADSLMPGWLSGYDAVTPSPARTMTRDQVAKLPPAQRTFTLRVDAADAVARSIAERIAVDARQRGLSIMVQAPTGLAPRPDVRLLRLGITPSTPDRALTSVMEALGRRTVNYVSGDQPPAPDAPLLEVYRKERALLEGSVVVPVVHLPEVYGLGERLDSWNGPVIDAAGGWNLSDVWLKAGTP
jgi:MarR-like DNA-binding transcriptional regulator SgrR of sgrS sRNA